MKTRSNPGQGPLKSNRVHAYVRQAKKTHAVSHQSLAPSGSRAGMSPGLAATIAKLRYSPPAAIMVEINKQKKQKQLMTRDAMLLQEEEYAEEVLEYWREREANTHPEVPNMDMQPELGWEIRPCLTDFLIEVHLMNRMRPETLYLAINIVDRYISKRVVLKKHYQLIGCAALWIAAKYEDEKSRIPSLAEFVDHCHNQHDQSAFVQMERHVLATIGWDIGHPTAESWLRVKCSGESYETPRTQHVTRFLMELTLFKREFVHLRPSQIAHGSLCLAKYILGESRLSRSEDTTESREVSEALDELCSEGVQRLSETVCKKYQPHYYSGASRIISEWYARGNRYHYSPFPEWNIDLPSSSEAYKTFYDSSLSRSGSSMDSISSTLSASGSSDAGDSMPATPITPIYPSAESYVSASGKENQAQGMLFGITPEMAMRAKDEPIAKSDEVLVPINHNNKVYSMRSSFIVPQPSAGGSHAVQYDFSVV
ncbi:hypothetical protein DACRYDRAFT_24810 [Dacryopinax primogenitus]|uniref:Uncharacterized protein n=1 Tax=Dacryopinax primogenitus (strain DJM 731) TaxID=1858805 RepID=M5FWP9_DACPD|nr:uncharacterized protein DACRYDRAFT_24810 [Dacryopinax primogenitus]EJT97861.1 hypothetical protein DACRYDRAFT_24810 [Dacryopinax primogenitus]